MGTTESTERRLFKDYFDVQLVELLGSRLHALAPHFDLVTFRTHATKQLETLEMKARVAQIANAMIRAFPGPPADDLRLVMTALPAPAACADGITASGFPWWPFSDVIATHGLGEPAVAFDAMMALTRCFTSEFAIRPFLAADLHGTLARLEQVVDHPDQHVRRWVSEGTRTRLPWGARVPGLVEALDKRLALLNRLRHDPQRYVQRSVANHLADILKDDVAVGLEILKTWASEAHPATRWIVRHAARDTLKKCHPEAMALFGFEPDNAAAMQVDHFAANETILAIGDSVQLALTLVNTGPEAAQVRVDYALISPTASGRVSRKVFRWAERSLAPAESVDLKTNHAFIPRTIRKVHPGTHRFEILVNGNAKGEAAVHVTPR